MTRLALVIALFLTACPFMSSAASAQPYYKDKTLTFVVGFAAGGGMDLPARLFVRHLKKTLEGSPTIVVQNMPGAAGGVALNYLSEVAQKDGLTVAFDSWSPIAQIAGIPGARYDYTKMTIVAALRSAPYVMFARKDIVPGGLTDPAGIVKAKGFVYAGQQPSLVLDLHGRLSLDVLKADYRYVKGYRGATDIRLAIERGEAHVTTHGLQGYREGVEPNMVKKGIAVPLWYFQRKGPDGRYVDSPLVQDMKPFLEVYRRARGGEPSGIEWDALETLSTFYGVTQQFVWGPPGMDPRALAELREAFYKTVADPESIAEQEKIFGFRYEAVDIKEAESVVAKLKSVDPKLVAFFKKYMERDS